MARFSKEELKRKLQQRRTRGKSFTKFNASIDRALKDGFFDECMHDVFCVLSEIAVVIRCPQLSRNCKSYEVATQDSKYSMSSKNLIRSLLTFLKKTLPIQGIYTDGQIKRIKAIMKINDMYLDKLTRVKHKGILTRWELDV